MARLIRPCTLLVLRFEVCVILKELFTCSNISKFVLGVCCEWMCAGCGTGLGSGKIVGCGYKG